MPTLHVPDVTVQLSNLCCASCGIHYAAEAKWVNARRNDHATFYCPNGHRQWFPDKSDAEKAADEAKRLRGLLKSEQSYASDLHQRLDAERKQHASTKGQLTKTRKRAAAALCPCCNRSFVQLRRHLSAKHPDYDASS